MSNLITIQHWCFNRRNLLFVLFIFLFMFHAFQFKVKILMIIYSPLLLMHFIVYFYSMLLYILQLDFRTILHNWLASRLLALNEQGLKKCAQYDFLHRSLILSANRTKNKNIKNILCYLMFYYCYNLFIFNKCLIVFRLTNKIIVLF